MSENKSIIYVDDVYGNDANTGNVMSPVQTLQHAYDIAFNGAVISLTGNGNSYGTLTITKNITITSANGSRAITSTLAVVESQVSIANIDFENGISEAITISNTYGGGVNIIGNIFVGISTPISIQSAHYVSIHQNTFEVYTTAITVNDCIELVVSSNYFIGPQAISVVNADYIDIFNNTLIGGFGGGGAPIVPNENLRVIFVKVTSTVFTRKRIDLPSFAYLEGSIYNVSVNATDGTSFLYNKDYRVINGGFTVSWAGLKLEQELHINDVLRIAYSEGSVLSPGTSITTQTVSYPASRIDSNNITDSSIGIYFTDDLKIRYNNFYGDTTRYTGAAGPTDATGNITLDPKYVDKPNADFHLQPNSPDINAADPNRWDQVYTDLTLGFTGLNFTGIQVRPGVAPFNRNIDLDGRHRDMYGTLYDIGSYEYGITGSYTGLYTYVNERGYDEDVLGDLTGPYATLDRAFEDTRTIIVKTNPLGYGDTGPIGSGATGIQYGRYFSNNITLSTDQMIIGSNNKESIAYIYPSYLNSGYTGIYVGPTLPESETSGETGSINNPFRDIKDAITKIGLNPGTIFVYPGFYPNFNGADNIKIIGIPKLNGIPLSKNVYNEIDSSKFGWDGSVTSTFSNQSIYFNDTENITSAFEMTGNINVRFDYLVLVDSLEAGISNASNFVSVKKYGSNIYFRYGTGGNSFTSSAPNTDTSLRTSISLNGDKATVNIKGTSIGSTTIINREVVFLSGYADPWKVDVTYTDSGNPGSTGVFNNIIAEADLIYMPGSTSQFGVTGVSTERNVFGILGERGMTGLNSWYGARL